MPPFRVSVVVLLLTAALVATFIPPPAHTSTAGISGSSTVWQAQWGGFNSVYDLAAVSPTDIWAVGSNIVHYDGHAWRAVNPEPYYIGLTGIDLVSDTEGWAVGWEKAIPLSDAKWGEHVRLPADTSLQDVAVVSQAAAWAVGWHQGRFDGVIFHYDGDTWDQSSVVSDVPLHSVWMASATEGWAVGESGVMLQYDGSSWESVPPVTDQALLSVYGVSATDVWAVGGSSCDSDHSGSRVILHYNGNEWSVMLSDSGRPVYGLVDVTARGEEAWAVGCFQTRLRYDGDQWHDLGQLEWSEPLGGLQTVDFVHGEDYALAAGDTARIVRLTGDTYEDVHGLSMPLSSLTGILMLSPDDGWAVGLTRPALRYDGTRWQRVAGPSELTQLHDVDGVSPSDVWGVGEGGLILHFDGDTWQQAGSPLAADSYIRRVRMLTANEGWAIGSSLSGHPDARNRGSVLRYDGLSWQIAWELDGSFPNPLYDVDATSPEDVWATGEGVVWHFDGTHWQELPMPSPDGDAGPILSIDMVSATDGWAGGEGAIYRFDGHEWRPELDLPYGAGVHGLQMRADGTGWAAAWYGQVLYRDGTNWQFVRGLEGRSNMSAVPWGLLDVAALDAGDKTLVWVSGVPETILHGAIPKGSQSPTPGATISPESTVPRPIVPRVYLPKVDNRQ